MRGLLQCILSSECLQQPQATVLLQQLTAAAQLLTYSALKLESLQRPVVSDKHTPASTTSARVQTAASCCCRCCLPYLLASTSHHDHLTLMSSPCPPDAPAGPADAYTLHAPHRLVLLLLLPAVCAVPPPAAMNAVLIMCGTPHRCSCRASKRQSNSPPPRTPCSR